MSLSPFKFFLIFSGSINFDYTETYLKHENMCAKFLFFFTYAFPKSKEFNSNCVNVNPENFAQTLLRKKQNKQQWLQVTENFLTKR